MSEPGSSSGSSAEHSDLVGDLLVRSARVQTMPWSPNRGIVSTTEQAHLVIVPDADADHDPTLRRQAGEVAPRRGRSMVIFVPAGSTLQLPRNLQASGVSASLPVRLVDSACGERGIRWRMATGESSPRIAEAVRWMHREALVGGREPQPLVSRLLARLVAAAFGGTSRRADDAWLVAPALGRISARLHEGDLRGLSIASLAAEVGLGASAFSRAFRGSIGITPGRYLTEVRLDRVAAMLSTTDLPLATITRQVGLGSVAHVSKQFGLRHGIGVRRFRATNKGPRFTGEPRLVDGGA